MESSSPIATSPPCNVIYVKEKTFLCRWGREDEGFCRIQSQQPQQRKLKRQAPTAGASDKDNKGVDHEQQEGDALPHEKYKDASEKSGIQLGSVSLVPLRFPTAQVAGKQIKKAHEDPCQPFSTILSQLGKKDTASNANNNGSSSSSPQKESSSSSASATAAVKIAYCVRREGCGACRMHGQALTELTQTLENVQVMGIIKEPKNSQQAESDAANLALANFREKYFPFPLFRDTQWDVFKFLGDRKLSNATLVARAPKLVRLYAQKNIENVIFDGGKDVYTQGGILVFDAQSKLRYVYYDRYGDELDVDALRLAIEDCQRVAKGRLGMASRVPTRRTAPK